MPTDAPQPLDHPRRSQNPTSEASVPSLMASITDPWVAHVVNPALEELLTRIRSWKMDGKMKNGNRLRVVEMTDRIRAGGARQVRATEHSSTEASNAAMVFVFTQQVLAAVKDRLKDLLPTGTPTTTSTPTHAMHDSLGTCHAAHKEHAQPTMCPRTPQPPGKLLVTISMAKADHKSPNRQRSPTELKAQIEMALGKLTAPGLHDGKVYSVRKLASGNIRVQANTEEQAKLLLLHGQEWFTLFKPDACVHRETYMLVTNYVPTSFDPRADGAKTAVYRDNQGTIPLPTAIREMCWLHEQKDTTQWPQTCSSSAPSPYTRPSLTSPHKTKSSLDLRYPPSRGLAHSGPPPIAHYGNSTSNSSTTNNGSNSIYGGGDGGLGDLRTTSRCAWSKSADDLRALLVPPSLIALLHYHTPASTSPTNTAASNNSTGRRQKEQYAAQLLGSSGHTLSTAGYAQTPGTARYAPTPLSTNGAPANTSAPLPVPGKGTTNNPSNSTIGGSSSAALTQFYVGRRTDSERSGRSGRSGADGNPGSTGGMTWPVIGPREVNAREAERERDRGSPAPVLDGGAGAGVCAHALAQLHAEAAEPICGDRGASPGRKGSARRVEACGEKDKGGHARGEGQGEARGDVPFHFGGGAAQSMPLPAAPNPFEGNTAPLLAPPHIISSPRRRTRRRARARSIFTPRWTRTLPSASQIVYPSKMEVRGTKLVLHKPPSDLDHGAFCVRGCGELELTGDLAPARTCTKLLDFKPFNPRDKHTEIAYHEVTGGSALPPSIPLLLPLLLIIIVTYRQAQARHQGHDELDHRALLAQPRGEGARRRGVCDDGLCALAGAYEEVDGDDFKAEGNLCVLALLFLAPLEIAAPARRRAPSSLLLCL
ncbi:hypothetical protein B0H10DRAFT_2238513 [Mycena sp. CBHHK59/15]|nr:hypothetical protein B0H10DRAFT_2238513 [Mycena sp. CBHHK59/15]